MSNTVLMILNLLCGVALFLYGMSSMGDGLKKVAGNKLELILYRLTNSPLKGFLLGTAVTCVIQSSSAASVMVVGFVNSGMMKVSQAIGVILGANIGTSITGWIICLSYLDAGGIASFLSSATITAVVAIIGIILKMFGKKEVYAHVGNILLGFAVLMTGMSVMSQAVSPLRESPFFIDMMTSLNNPLLGTLFGVAFAAVLQSASAAVGVLQALSTTGAIAFGAAFPMVLGISVGASAPVLLAAVGANKNGQRTSFLYLIVAVIASILALVGFYGFDLVFHFDWMDKTMDPFSIAIMNTAYRAITMSLLLPCVPLLKKLMFIVIPKSEKDEESTAEFDKLEDRFLSNPQVAYEQSMQVMEGMAKKAKKNVLRALNLLDSYSSEGYKKVVELEQTLNKYEDKLGGYLMKLTVSGVGEEQGKTINKALQAISDLEQMSHYALEIANTAKKMHDANQKFSLKAVDELTVVETAIEEIVTITVNGFINNDSKIVKSVFPLKDLVTMNCNEIKKRHVLRLRSGECHTEQGLALYDLLNDMLHIAQHCASLSLDIIKMDEKEFNLHRFLRKYQAENENEYSDLLHQYEIKYSIQS